MSTKIRSELSKKNQYAISKHRYLELKHFCMQYNEWKEALKALNPLRSSFKEESVNEGKTGDPTSELASRELYFRDRIRLLERAATESIGDYWSCLLLGIVQELPYETIRARYNIPFCRESWYVAYRRFFWLLDQKRK